MSLWKRGALAFVLVLCAAIALAPSTGPSKRIPNGVRISGVNVSNLDAGQARQVISARYSVPLRFRFDQREWTASPTRLIVRSAARKRRLNVLSEVAKRTTSGRT